MIAENIFGLPGLGALAVQSITTQDLPVIIGIVMLGATFVVLPAVTSSLIQVALVAAVGGVA